MKNVNVIVKTLNVVKIKHVNVVVKVVVAKSYFRNIQYCNYD